jgi:threonine dehydrogenase-like Zn-dependent dehydrogenase
MGMNEKMRAVRAVAPGKTEFIEAPVPELRPGHALVRPVLLSLCGSDVRLVYYAPEEAYPFPVGTSGHEMVGVVEAVDAPGSDIQVGDLALTLAPYHTAMVEYFMAPLADVLVLPPGRPLEHLLMAQQLGTVIYACKRLPNVVGKDAVVIGQGSAGLFFDAMLRRMGARHVVGLDLKEARVAAGLRFGATASLNNAHVDAPEAVEDVLGGNLADLVVEAAGEIEAINLAAHLVKARGQLLYFGIPHAQRFDFDYWTFFCKFCDTVTSSGAMLEPGRTSFQQAVDLIARGEIDVSSMVTHRFPFERVPEAYELARSRNDGVIKVVIEMLDQGKPLPLETRASGHALSRY